MCIFPDEVDIDKRYHCEVSLNSVHIQKVKNRTTIRTYYTISSFRWSMNGVIKES